MKFEIMIILVMAVLNRFVCLNSEKTIFSFECLIQNGQYGFELLYDSDEMTNLNRSISTPFVYPLKYLTNSNKVRWILEATNDSNSLDIVSLKSYSSNKYLCASSHHLDRFKLRRIVYLSNYFEKEACEWKLEKVISKSNQDEDQLGMRSYITNVKYNEPLYAASYFFKKDQFKRNPYLWHNEKEKFKSKQFEWMIECSIF